MSFAISYLSSKSVTKNDVAFAALDLLIIAAIVTLSVSILQNADFVKSLSFMGKEGAIGLLATGGALFLGDIIAMICANIKAKAFTPGIEKKSFSIDSSEKDVPLKSGSPIDPMSHFTKAQSPGLGDLMFVHGVGVYSEEIFELPEGVFILVPHSEGLTKPYDLDCPQDIEDSIELDKEGNCMQFPQSTQGYRLYGPGDRLNNLGLAYRGSIDTEEPEDQSGYQLCKVSRGDRSICYPGKINKAVIYGSLNLEQMVSAWKNSSKSNERIIFFPLMSNYSSPEDPQVSMI